MPEQPIPVTEYDVKEPNLLLRYLRKVSDRLVNLSGRIGKLETTPPPPSMADVRAALEATGTHPLYLGNLLGQAAEPQPAEVTHFDTTPTGLVLQALRDGQLVTVGSSSTGDAMYRVVGGNPNTLRQINPAVAGSVIEVADSNFTVFDDASTSRKMQFSNGSITAGNTRVMTVPDTDQILAGRNVNNAFSATQTFTTQTNLGNSNLIVNSTGRISTYNGVTLSTDGNGVPSVVATAKAVATTSSVALTTVYTTPATPAHAYRLSLNIFNVTTGVSTGEVQSTLSASNGVSIVNITSSAISLQSTGESYYVTVPLRVGGALPIQLTISRTGTSTGQYSAYMAVEAL